MEGVSPFGLPSIREEDTDASTTREGVAAHEHRIRLRIRSAAPTTPSPSATSVKLGVRGVKFTVKAATTTFQPPLTWVEASSCFVVRLPCSSGPFFSSMVLLEGLFLETHARIQKGKELRLQVRGEAAHALTWVEVQTGFVKHAVWNLCQVGGGGVLHHQEGTTTACLYNIPLLPSSKAPQKIILHFQTSVDVIRCFAQHEPWIQVVGCMGTNLRNDMQNVVNLWPILGTPALPLPPFPARYMTALERGDKRVLTSFPLESSSICKVFTRCDRATGRRPRHPKTCIQFTEQQTCQIQWAEVAIHNKTATCTVPLPVHTGDCVTHLEFRVSTTASAVAWWKQHWAGGCVSMQAAGHRMCPVSAVEEVEEEDLSLPVACTGRDTASVTLRAAVTSLTTPLFTWAGQRGKPTPSPVSLFLNLFFQQSAASPPSPLHILAGLTTVTLSTEKLATTHVMTRHLLFPNVRLCARAANEDVHGTVVQCNGLVRVFKANDPSSSSSSV